MTNADRIRAMTDSELTVFLDGFSCRCVDCEESDGRGCPIYEGGNFCTPGAIHRWLTKEYAGGNLLDKRVKKED